MRYFKKSFIRYVAMGLAMAFVSFILASCDVHAESMSLSDFAIDGKNPEMYYNIGGQTASSTSFSTLNYGASYLKFFDNVVTTSATLLTPSFYQITINTTGMDFEYISFNVIMRDAQLSGVSVNFAVGTCKVDTGYTFVEGISKFNSYNITCPNIKMGADNFRVIFYPTFTVDAGANIYVQRWFTVGNYSSSVTNNLLQESNNKQQQIINKTEETNNKLTETKESIDKVDETMNNGDSAEATDEAGSFFSGFESDTFGLTSIITAPLNLIQSVTSSTCSTMGIPVPFVENTTLELPCLRGIYEKHFGTFLNIYQTITFGIVAYWVCVRIFALVKDFKNPDHDEIEVLDL